jgi:hypothetical protein
MYHLDMSVWAFERLAEKKWGVIGISWRDVPCWYKPKNAAKQPWWAKPTPAPYWYKAPCEHLLGFWGVQGSNRKFRG